MKTTTSLMSKQATGWFKGLAVLMIVASHYAEWWSWFTPSEGNTELFRQGLTRLGDYGACLFLLFSGYGLVKSLKGGRVNLLFVWKRIRTVYIPYLIIMGAIELLSGGFTDITDFGYFVSGYDHWYMFVLFILYTGFMILWAIPMPKWARVILFTVFTYAFSWKLYTAEMAEFWYCSNILFALGVLIAEYEKPFKWIADKLGLLLIPILTICMLFVIRSGLGLDGQPLPTEITPTELQELTCAQLLWSMLVILISAKWPFYDPVIIFLGKNSLYIYLTHTYLFMRCVNLLTELSFTERFAVAAVITIAVSSVCWLVFDASPTIIKAFRKRLSNKSRIK